LSMTVERLALDLSDLGVEKLEISHHPDEVSLESLMGGQAMTELGASILPVGCCSCCLPCCCCC
jgi:hypothetical protein